MDKLNRQRAQSEFVDAHTKNLPYVWRSEVVADAAKWGFGDGSYDPVLLKNNTELMRQSEALSSLLKIANGDFDLQELARSCACHCRNINTIYGRDGGAAGRAREYVAEYVVDYPDVDGFDEQFARLGCSKWWLRKLRVSHAMAREAAAIEAKRVHAKKDVYCSEDTLERRGQQLRRNAKLMADIELKSESGRVMKLADIAKAGMANQDNRRAELMTRITGFEQLANEYGHKAVFVTLTCPSRMHRICVERDARGYVKKIWPNQKYDGTKPDAAQKYLVHCWARARARLLKAGIKFYGLRVAEPHHDGTPHWHLILWCNEVHLKNLKWHITQPFVEDSRQEIWNDVSPRVKFVDIRASKGTAAGYVIKYVSKNLGGIYGESADEAEGKASESLAARVEAWASTWRIRQFQQVGGHSVTVWRELRRVNEDEAQAAGGVLLRAWVAAQKIKTGEEVKKANFADYIKAMGGLDRPPRRALLMLEQDVILQRGRYGEAWAFLTKGVREAYGKLVCKSNRERWVRV